MTVTTLAYTGAVQAYTVPAGVTFVTIEAWGAAGGAGPVSTGGLGGYAKGALVVSPGTVVSVYVGQMGVGGGGGWNGGGAKYASGQGGGGGGASDIRVGGTALANRVIVAGGGGGGGGYPDSSRPGASGGGASGEVMPTGHAGDPGTQTTGYAPGVGGDGTIQQGGGGGGGYYGGYGGSGFASGGGGSGYTSTLASPTMTNGLRSGNGQVVITATNTAPSAPTLTTPANSLYIIASVANTFGWTPNDPDPGDYQTRADFRYKKAGDAVWTTTNNVATTLPTYVLAGATWTAGFQYEWQVSTYDAQSLQSPWSASSFVNVITSISAPTIATPGNASTQYATPVSMSWTLPAGFTQEAYQVQRNAAADGSGTMYYDSGIVVTTALTASIPLDATAGRTDYLRARFRYYGNWSAWASISIINQFGPPHVPTLTCTINPATASVSATITNLAASGGYADTLVNDLVRISPDGSSARIAANLPPNATFVDKLPGAGANIYIVTAYAANGATSSSLPADTTVLDGGTPSAPVDLISDGGTP